MYNQQHFHFNNTNSTSNINPNNSNNKTNNNKQKYQNQQETYAAVQEWLQSVLNNKNRHSVDEGGGAHPIEYEVNSRTLSILRNIAAVSSANTTDAHAALQDIEQRSHEYRGQNQQLSTALQSLSLPSRPPSQSPYNINDSNNNNNTIDEDNKNDSSPSHWHTTVSLASLAERLELRNTHTASFIAGLQHVQSIAEAAVREQSKQQREARQLAEDTRSALEYHTRLKTLSSEMDAEQEQRAKDQEEKERYTQYLKQKRAQYTQQAQDLRAQISESVDVEELSTVSHAMLTELADAIQTKKTELEPLQQRLERYMDLSPDISLARMQLKEAKEDLSRLEQQVSESLKNINLA